MARSPTYWPCISFIAESRSASEPNLMNPKPLERPVDMSMTSFVLRMLRYFFAKAPWSCCSVTV